MVAEMVDIGGEIEKEDAPHVQQTSQNTNQDLSIRVDISIVKNDDVSKMARSLVDNGSHNVMQFYPPRKLDRRLQKD